MEKNKEGDQGEYYLERFAPILPRPVTDSDSWFRETNSSKRKQALKKMKKSAKLAKSDVIVSSCSLVTSSRSGLAPLASTSYSQIPIMVVNPFQHQKSGVESETSSTQTVSTCAPSNTGTVTSSGISSTDSSLQFLVQGQPEGTFVQGSYQNYSVLLGNSLPAILPGSFVPNQLIQPSPFLGSVFIPTSIQGNALQGNLAQGLSISGGVLPVNQFSFGIQNTPQFSSCLQQVPVMNPGISLQAVQTNPVSSIRSTEVVKEISTTESAATQSSYKFVVEPDPEFDEKMKDATIVTDTNVSNERAVQSGSTVCIKTPNEKPKENPTNEEENLPKIESCYSMKKLSLKEMLVILNDGHNVLSFVKPGTNDYYRAKTLCEAVAKYHITKLHSGIDDSFFTSLVSPYISLNEALHFRNEVKHLKNEVKHVNKEEEKQKKTKAVQFAKDSARVFRATGKETAENILRWKTEKLEHFNPDLYQQISTGAKKLQNVCSLTRSEAEVTRKETNQKKVYTCVNLSESDMNKKARKNDKNETNTFLETSMVSETKEPWIELTLKTSESDLKLIGNACTIIDEKGKESDVDVTKKAFSENPLEDSKSKKVSLQKQVVSRPDVADTTSEMKLPESDAEVLKDSYKQEVFEKIMVSRESGIEFTSNVHSERMNNPKETLSEAELIRKAFTLSDLRSTARQPLSTNHVSSLQAPASSSQEVMKHHAEKFQNQCYLNVSGEEIVVIKSEPDDDMEYLEALAPCESERNSNNTGFSCLDGENIPSSAPNKKYTVNSKNIPTESVEYIASKESSVEQLPFEERGKSETSVATGKPKTLAEISKINTKNAVSSDSSEDTKDDAAEKGQAIQVQEKTGAIYLPNEFILGKWSQNILAINQSFSGETEKNKNCCYLCGVLFPNERVIWSHILNEHTSEKLNSPAIEYPNYICTHCFQNIGSLSLAQKHEVDVHLCEFPCYFCGLSLDDSFTMLSHVATVHSRLFPCNLCKGHFLGKWEFQKHCSSEDHKQSSPDFSKFILICLFCNCKFDSEMTLVQHLTMKHLGKAVPNSRECVCLSCRHPFLDAHALQNHRDPDARKVDKHRPVSTTSLIKLAAQYTENKKTVDILRQTKQKRSGTSHCMLIDLIKKVSPSNESGYREIDFKQRKYEYPFEKLVKYCDLDSDITEETAVLIMDELMKFILSQYPNLQLDTGRKDFHNLIVAVSRSQRFTQLLRSLNFKPLAWTANVKTCIKMFLEKVQASCYRNADFTQLCDSLQKSLNFLEESKNPVKHKLPSLTSEFPLFLSWKNQKEETVGIPWSVKTGTVNVGFQAKQKNTQPNHSETLPISSLQSDRPKVACIPSMSTVSTVTSSIASLPGFSSQNKAIYKVVQVGMNYVFVPVSQTTIPVAAAVTSDTTKGIPNENKKAIGSYVTVKQSTDSNSLPIKTELLQCSAEKLLKNQSECNTVAIEERRKKIETENSSSNILADESKKTVKKYVDIAPKGGAIAPKGGARKEYVAIVPKVRAPPTHSSYRMLKSTNMSVCELLKKKMQSTNVDTDSGNDGPKNESDSVVESSVLLKQWFVKVKKPLSMLNKAKVKSQINENKERANKESRKFVVNNHLKRLATKKKGFQIANKYRAHTSKKTREVLIKWMIKASGSRQEKKRDVKRKKLTLEQSHDHILRKRKPVSYRYEGEMLSDSDDETQKSSSSNNTDSDEEWKPSDEESEDEFCDGLIMEEYKTSNGDDSDVVAHGAKSSSDFKEEQNKSDFEQTHGKTVMHSEKVQNTRILTYTNGNVIIDENELQKDISIESEIENSSSNSTSYRKTEVKKQESMPVFGKFGNTFLKDDTSSENTKHLRERKSTVGKLENLQCVNLKRHAPSLGEECIAPKLVRVANSVASLNSCTKKTPEHSDLNQSLKCCFVKMERCDQADRLSDELLVVCIKDYCERTLTRSFVKQICKEDQDRTKSEMHSQNNLHVNSQTDNSKKEEVKKANNASTEKKTTSPPAVAVRGRGRPRKTRNIVKALSATEEGLQEINVNEDNSTGFAERCCMAVERRRGRPRKKVDNLGENSKIVNTEETSNGKSGDSFSIAGKNLRPRKSLNYYEEESSDKREFGDNDHSVFLNEHDGDEYEGCEKGLLRRNSLCHNETEMTIKSRERVRISRSEFTSIEDPSKWEEEVKASFNDDRFSKPDARVSPRPDLINITNNDNVTLTTTKSSLGCDGADIADFVSKEASRSKVAKVSELGVRICPKPDLLNVTNQKDIDLSACKIHVNVSKSTFNKTGTDNTCKEAKKLFGEQSKVSTKTETNMSEHAEDLMETDLTILPIHIKQEIDLSDDISDSIGESVAENNTCYVIKTVSKSFQNQDIQDFCMSVSLKKEDGIISHQLPSSCPATSCMSSLVSQASSNFQTFTSSACTKQVNGASPHSSRKPEICLKRKDSKQALSSEPTRAKVFKEKAMQIVNRYPVLFLPPKNSTAVSDISSASPGSAPLRAPPPLVMMSTAKNSQTNAQPAALQTPTLETSASSSFNVQMHSKELSSLGTSSGTSSLGTSVKNVGENQAQTITPVPQSAVYFVPVSGTNQFIPVNIFNPGIQTGQLQQTVQTQQSNQFQQTGNIQQAQEIQGTQQIGHTPLTNFSNLSCNPVQLPSFPQTAQQPVITSLQTNSQFLQTDVQKNASQGLVVKQSNGESESTSKNGEPDLQIEPSEEKSSQLQQPLKKEYSEEESNKHTAVVHQSCHALPQQGTNQNFVLQNLQFPQPVAHIQGLQVPLIQTGQVQIQGLQPAFGMGMLPNQLQGLNQSGLAVQGFQANQTGVQTPGNTSQAQQQKIRMISPQGTSHTLMVNQQTPLAPGQLIYVPNTTGSDAVYSGHVIATSMTESQAVPSVVNTKSKDTGKKKETVSESLNKQETASSSQAGRKPEQSRGNISAEHTDVEAEEVEYTHAEGEEENQGDVPFDGEKAHVKSQACKICSRSFLNPESLTAHFKWHSQGKYACLECKVFFQDKFDSILHKALKHSKKFDCKVCSKTFHTLNMALAHSVSKHNIHLRNNLLENIRMKFSCYICGRTSDQERKLRIHLKEHFGGFFCDLCGNQIENADALENHCITWHGKCYECFECGQNFNSQDEIHRHFSDRRQKLVSCASEKNLFLMYYKCKTCDRKFDMVKERDYAYFHFKYEHSFDNNVAEEGLDWCI